MHVCTCTCTWTCICPCTWHNTRHVWARRTPMTSPSHRERPDQTRVRDRTLYTIARGRRSVHTRTRVSSMGPPDDLGHRQRVRTPSRSDERRRSVPCVTPAPESTHAYVDAYIDIDALRGCHRHMCTPDLCVHVPCTRTGRRRRRRTRHHSTLKNKTKKGKIAEKYQNFHRNHRFSTHHQTVLWRFRGCKI